MWTWKHHALALALAGASAGAQALDLIDVWQAAREHDAAGNSPFGRAVFP